MLSVIPLEELPERRFRAATNVALDAFARGMRWSHSLRLLRSLKGSELRALEAHSLELEALQGWLLRHASAVLRGPGEDGRLLAVEKMMAAGRLGARHSACSV